MSRHLPAPPGRHGGAAPARNEASEAPSAQDLAALFMVGLAAVLSFCEQAAADGGRASAQAIVERLNRIVGSGRAKAQALILQLRARRLTARERDIWFPSMPSLCMRAGLTPQPEIYFYDSATRNAFALGDRGASAIIVSQGLLTRLNSSEMSAVLAHEIGHILNGDGQLFSLAAELNQMVGHVAAATIVNVLSGRAGIRAGRTSALQTVVLVALAPLFSAMLQHGLSRTREYDADRLAACLMGQPFSLVDALKKLNLEFERGRRVPPFSSGSVGMLMRSHPDAAERIDRLMQLPRARCQV
jgi:heat shock protein HtpX